MTMRTQVGGGTEWYRGAYRAALAFARSAAAQGHVVHAPARTWFALAMQSRRDSLVSIVDQAMRDANDGGLSTAQQRALRDLIDSHAAFDHRLAARLPSDLALLWKDAPH